jgi:hypothetical protein
MADYFPDTAKDTYIYFSENKIITMTFNILQIMLRDGEYEVRKPLDLITGDITNMREYHTNSGTEPVDIIKLADEALAPDEESQVEANNRNLNQPFSKSVL